MNDILPASVRVLEVTEAPADFHARHSARAKTYRYRIFREAICPPFLARYVWHYPYPLDEEEMARAAAVVVGEHDFTSFAAVDPERGKRGCGREFESCAADLLLPAWERHGRELVYTVRGSGFLHHMVRNLVGTFMLVGKGTLQVRRCDSHSRGAQPFGGGSDCAGERTVSGRCGVLADAGLVREGRRSELRLYDIRSSWLPIYRLRRTIASVNPATGEVLRELECAGEVEVAAAVARARTAQAAWA